MLAVTSASSIHVNFGGIAVYGIEKVKAFSPEAVISEDIISQENLNRIFRYLKGIRFGTVTLIIQDGKVIQVEKTEKIRLK